MKKLVTLLIFTCVLFFGGTSGFAAASQLIIINKATNQLTYYENNKLVKTFSVATGKTRSATPEGKFKVANKIKNRPYYKGKIAGGDPKNPLGKRWIGLDALNTKGTTYGIHGNNNSSSIGKYVSAGCVRMYNEEVDWLFNKVKVNTPVVITTSNKSFVSIASANGFKVTGNPAAVTASAHTVLKKGSRGAEVVQLQKQLTALGYSTKGTDGVFGANTEKAVKQFQKAKKLTVDGIVGPSTKKAIGMI